MTLVFTAPPFHLEFRDDPLGADQCFFHLVAKANFMQFLKIKTI